MNSVIRDLPTTTINIQDLLFRRRDSSQIIKDPGRALTYARWHFASAGLADRLAAGSPKGGPIGILLPNSVAYAIAYFGILYAGRVVAPFNPDLTDEELVREIDFCDAVAVITGPVLRPRLDGLRPRLPRLKKVFELDIPPSLPGAETAIQIDGEEVEKDSSFKPVSTPENEVALLLPTSGTTRSPRRVMLSHRNLLVNMRAHRESAGLAEGLNVLISLPMFFGYCNTTQFLLHIELGGNIVILDRPFFPGRFLETVEREQIHCFTAVPAMLQILLAFQPSRDYDLESLSHIFFGGCRPDPELVDRLKHRFPGVEFIQTYGLTEAAPRVTTLRGRQAARKPGSVGLPIPGVAVQILDDQGRPLPAGERGEIVVSGENIMRGYLKNGTATREILMGGVLHTGDIGSLDEEGFLYVWGRMKSLIISAGINLLPEEVEECLAAHPAVQDVLVEGIPDDALGEIPVASVVVKTGHSLSAQELYRFSRARLAPYKIPRRFYFVESIQRTHSGKIQRDRRIEP